MKLRWRSQVEVEVEFEVEPQLEVEADIKVELAADFSGGLKSKWGPV